MSILQQFAKARIATRLALTLGLIVVVVVVSAVAYGAKKLQDTTRLLTQLEQQEWQVSVLAATWQGNAQALSARVTASMRMPAGAMRDSFLSEIRQSEEAIAASVATLDGLVLGDVISRQTKLVKLASNQMKDITVKLEELKRTGEYLVIDQLLAGDFERLRAAYLTSIDDLRNLASARASQATQLAR